VVVVVLLADDGGGSDRQAGRQASRQAGRGSMPRVSNSLALKPRRQVRASLHCTCELAHIVAEEISQYVGETPVV